MVMGRKYKELLRVERVRGVGRIHFRGGSSF
jgi:hypothetical protein